MTNQPFNPLKQQRSQIQTLQETNKNIIEQLQKEQSALQQEKAQFDLEKAQHVKECENLTNAQLQLNQEWENLTNAQLQLNQELKKFIEDKKDFETTKEQFQKQPSLKEVIDQLKKQVDAFDKTCNSFRLFNENQEKTLDDTDSLQNNRCSK